jgi:hypothetical protein
MSTKIIQTVRPLTVQGTELKVGSRMYHFTPNQRGDYVAEVVDKDVDTILSISAGYIVYAHQDEGVLPGYDIVTPEAVRAPSARASPPPPVARGEYAEKPGFGNRKAP